MPNLTSEELLGLALAGFKQLKAETNNNQEMFAVLTIINTLVNMDEQQKNKAATQGYDWTDEKG